jgi:hypothetical protein
MSSAGLSVSSVGSARSRTRALGRGRLVRRAHLRLEALTIALRRRRQRGECVNAGAAADNAAWRPARKQHVSKSESRGGRAGRFLSLSRARARAPRTFFWTFHADSRSSPE